MQIRLLVFIITRIEILSREAVNVRGAFDIDAGFRSVLGFIV